MQVSPLVPLHGVLSSTALPRHAPVDWQVSFCVHSFESSQVFPSKTALLHEPVFVSQTPAAWHWSPAPQSTGLPGTQAPA